MTPTKYSFFTKEDDAIRRIHTRLATEVGFNESVVLMQIDHLINREKNTKIHEDKYWTFDSVEKLNNKYFPFWGQTTLKQAIANLVKQGLLIKGNFNKRKFDKTNWYTVNYEKASQLQSILIGYTDEGGRVQPLVGIRPTIGQNPTKDKPETDQPIPEKSSEKSSENTSVMSKISENRKKDAQEEIKTQIKTQGQGQTQGQGLPLGKDVTTVSQKINRKRLRYNFGQLSPSEYRECMDIYDALEPAEKEVVDSYAAHETYLWSFIGSDEPEGKVKKFICEYISGHPVAQHWKSLTPEQRESELEGSPEYKKKKRADVLNALDLNDPNVNLIDYMYA